MRSESSSPPAPRRVGTDDSSSHAGLRSALFARSTWENADNRSSSRPSRSGLFSGSSRARRRRLGSQRAALWFAGSVWRCVQVLWFCFCGPGGSGCGVGSESTLTLSLAPLHRLARRSRSIEGTTVPSLQSPSIRRPPPTSESCSSAGRGTEAFGYGMSRCAPCVG